jgi:hypothetical protein
MIYEYVKHHHWWHETKAYKSNIYNI